VLSVGEVRPERELLQFAEEEGIKKSGQKVEKTVKALQAMLLNWEKGG